MKRYSRDCTVARLGQRWVLFTNADIFLHTTAGHRAKFSGVAMDDSKLFVPSLSLLYVCDNISTVQLDSPLMDKESEASTYCMRLTSLEAYSVLVPRPFCTQHHLPEEGTGNEHWPNIQNSRIIGTKYSCTLLAVVATILLICLATVGSINEVAQRTKVYLLHQKPSTWYLKDPSSASSTTSITHRKING